MSRITSLRIQQAPPSPYIVKEDSTRAFLSQQYDYLRGLSQQFNSLIDALNREREKPVLTNLDGSTSLPTQTLLPFNAKVDANGTYRQVDGALASWALRFDGATDLFEILYSPAGTDPIAWTQLWSTGSSGVPTFSQNIRWKSGTAFWGELDHVNTANRVYSFPDAAGTVPLKESAETISGAWIFNELVTLLKNLRWASGTSTFYATLDHANTADRTYTFQNRNGTIADDTDLAAKVSKAGDNLTGNLTADPGITVDGVDVGSHNHDGAGSNGAQIAHSALTGSTAGDPHTQYGFLAGRAGGQTFIGGTGAGDDLTLQTSSNASRGTMTLGTSTDEVKVASATGSVGFFGAAGVTKTAVADPAALATSETADAAYDATEQSMLNNLKTDVTALRTTLLDLVNALQALGLV